MKPFQKYSTLFSLYIAQSVPMSFFSSVLPIMMRGEKFSLTSIGLIQLLKLPWILKFLWAPLVDKNSTHNHHYKRWIIASELFYAACIISIAFFNLKTDFWTVVILMVLAIFSSATQDIASDALAIRILKKSERPFGNSMQSMGNFGGTLLGSGVLLMVYAFTGWAWCMAMLAVFVLIALLPLIFNVKKDATASQYIPKKAITLSDIFMFFRRKGIGRWLLILAFYYSGILGILSQLKPWMVDLGYNLKQIGFMVGIYGTGCGAMGAFAAGFILKYLGQRKSIILFSAYNIVAALFFLYIYNAGITKTLLYAAISVLWSAYSMSSVLVYTVSMGKVREGREGTDYSIQIVITHLQGILIAIMAGMLGDISMNHLFVTEVIMASLVFTLVLFSPRVTAEIKENVQKNKLTVNHDE